MLCKWNIQSNITFEVFDIRKPVITGKIATKFYINDFIKGINDSKKRYWVTVFDDLQLEEGDRVKLLDIDKIVTSMNPKTKKISQFIEAIVEVVAAKDIPKRETKVVNPYE